MSGFLKSSPGLLWIVLCSIRFNKTNQIEFWAPSASTCIVLPNLRKEPVSLFPKSIAQRSALWQWIKTRSHISFTFPLQGTMGGMGRTDPEEFGTEFGAMLLGCAAKCCVAQLLICCSELMKLNLLQWSQLSWNYKLLSSRAYPLNDANKGALTCP